MKSMGDTEDAPVGKAKFHTLAKEGLETTGPKELDPRGSLETTGPKEKDPRKTGKKE